MIPTTATLLFYRGLLTSCNYHCEYCPFTKRQQTKQRLQHDHLALQRFYHEIVQTDQPLELFFTPYGEALIHDYYMTILAKLTALPHISRVGIQTNNSFSINRLLAICQQEHGQKEKLTLWCSWHPSQINQTLFLRQCQRLYEANIEFSVGCVADVHYLEEIQTLWQQLPNTLPRWLNPLEGRAQPYTPKEIALFSQLDPLFKLGLSPPIARHHLCKGGKHHFVIKANGDIFPCHSSKRRIGNLYHNMFSPQPCHQRVCGCFLAYANRQDISELTCFKGTANFRIQQYSHAMQQHKVMT